MKQTGTIATNTIVASRITAPPLEFTGSPEFMHASTGLVQYKVCEAESGWYVQLECMCSILVAAELDSLEAGIAAANEHHSDYLGRMLGLRQ